MPKTGPERPHWVVGYRQDLARALKKGAVSEEKRKQMHKDAKLREEGSTGAGPDWSSD